jgi:hypothetical protein
MDEAIAVTTVDGVKQVVMQANMYVANNIPEICTPTANSFVFYQPWLMGFGGGMIGWGMDYEARYWINQNLKKSMGY